MKRRTHLLRVAIIIAIVIALLSVSVASAVESPPTGIPPSDFAKNYKGCLGPLRSKLAQGQFEGVGPFGKHFTGDVNPGSHQGTVGEEEFIKNVLGITDLAAFCAQFEK